MNWAALAARAVSQVAATKDLRQRAIDFSAAVKSGTASWSDASPEFLVNWWASEVNARWRSLPADFKRFEADATFAAECMTWLERTFTREGRFDGASAHACISWRVPNFWERVVETDPALEAPAEWFAKNGRGSKLKQMGWSHVISPEYVAQWRREREKIAAEREAAKQAARNRNARRRKPGRRRSSN